MSEFKIIVFDEGCASYVAGRHDERKLADRQVSDMAAKTYSEDGLEKPVFGGADDIVIIDGADKVVSVWNRHGLRSPEHFADFDFTDYLDRVEKRKAIRLIGFQITNLEREIIHGTNDDPFNLAPDEVLTGAAVLTAKGWAADRDYLVAEVFSARADDYVLVSDISLRDEPTSRMF
ncbi:hypothetical protein G6L37_03410 [Agrobacterium rubi]|nr:hypothetical protein [Agrobacterium rubi]NTF24419.1 hypothetical protein [Agrobacterium rubi]